MAKCYRRYRFYMDAQNMDSDGYVRAILLVSSNSETETDKEQHNSNIEEHKSESEEAGTSTMLKEKKLMMKPRRAVLTWEYEHETKKIHERFELGKTRNLPAGINKGKRKPKTRQKETIWTEKGSNKKTKT